MAQYNILNVKLSNLQPNKLKSEIKNDTEVTLKLSLNVVGDPMMRIIFCINFNKPKDKVQSFVKLLQIIFSSNTKLS